MTRANRRAQPKPSRWCVSVTALLCGCARVRQAGTLHLRRRLFVAPRARAVCLVQQGGGATNAVDHAAGLTTQPAPALITSSA